MQNVSAVEIQLQVKLDRWHVSLNFWKGCWGYHLVLLLHFVNHDCCFTQESQTCRQQIWYRLPCHSLLTQLNYPCLLVPALPHRQVVLPPLSFWTLLGHLSQASHWRLHAARSECYALILTNMEFATRSLPPSIQMFPHVLPSCCVTHMDFCSLQHAGVSLGFDPV